jgi:predicted  nucleic acid-binding Zn-ribbon protein
LQDLTRRLEQLRHDRDMLAVDVRNQQRVCEEKQRRAEQAHRQRMEAAKQADRTQLDIQKAEQEIARLNVQLNAIRNQKEFDALQHTILSHRADIQKWEDEGLFALQSADDLSRDEQRMTQETDAARQELEQIRQRVAEDAGLLAEQIDQVAQEVEDVRNGIAPGPLAAYDRLGGHTRSQPLAVVKDRVCQGCHTRITKQTENLLMRGHEIVYCHSCGRMLMLEE